MEFRIGQGIDVHRWKAGRALRLGGVEIPHEFGLDGHSDADALLHTLIDALCGASGIGDIGELFPNDDPRWKDADSRELLKQVVEMIESRGWRVVNIDSTVMSEQPKLSPYKRAMQESVAALLHLQPEDVGIKATTCEKLGFLGRGEGLLATSVALLVKEDR